MKATHLVGFLLVMLVLAFMLTLAIKQEEPAELELTHFSGVLFDVMYYSTNDCYMLIFTDGRILKAENQPREGWIIDGIYEITVYMNRTKIELVEGIEPHAKPKKNQKTPDTGKAF